MKTFIVLSAIVISVFGSLTDDINWKNVKEADLKPKGHLSGEHLPDISIQGRIFGANVAEPHQFPYQVLIRHFRFSEDMEEVMWCGGSLISREFVLTAAHCIRGVSRAEVHLGAHNIMEHEENQTVVFVSEEDLFVHPQYDPELTINDLALIRLPTPVGLNDFVQTIKLPRPTMLEGQLEGRVLLMTGWGRTGDDDDASSELRYANLRVLPGRTCALVFPHSFHDSQICVSGNVQSVCAGDSGGPLVAQEADGTNVVVGIASFMGNEGCEKGFPTVFTRVTSYLNWISHMTGIEIRN